MSEKVSLYALVEGKVQGVFFRAFVRQQADALNLTGFVRNLPSGAVEVQAEGDKEHLQSLLEQLKIGPPGASVSRVEATWSGFAGSFPLFTIRY